MAKNKILVCPEDAITLTTAKEFTLTYQGGNIDIFVVNWSNVFYAYRNSCPHTGVTLNWLAGQFFDYEQKYLQCATHGALFEVQTGLCLRGPCAGASLSALAVHKEDGALHVEINDAPP